MKRADGTKFQRTTPAQVAYIVEHWATLTCVEIEAAIGVRRQTVKAIASRKGLRKPMEVLTKIRREVNHGRAILRTKQNLRRAKFPEVGVAKVNAELPESELRPFALVKTRRAVVNLSDVGWLAISAPRHVAVATARVHRILDDEQEAA